MNKVKVITDSCADPCKELRERFDIDYALMSLVWDGKEVPASCDEDIFTFKELYDAMRNGKRIITQQVSDPEFERVFGKYLEQGYDIVYVACSTALSGSYNLGIQVGKRLMEKYPNQKIVCIDPKNSVGGEMLVAIEAAKAANNGAGVDEVAKVAQAASEKSMQFAAIGDLTYLKRAGRVKASAAFFGNLFGIKPILISNRIGENEAVKKVKGRKNSLDEIVDMLQKSLNDPERPASEQMIIVAHADCINDAHYLVEQVKAKINPKEVYINPIGPTIGASVGPETIALYGFGDQYATLGE